MKRKVWTTLDAALYRKVKDIAHRQGRSTNAVIEDALARFLADNAASTSVVAETKGTYKVCPNALRAGLVQDLYMDR